MQKFPGIPVGNFMMANSREFQGIPEREFPVALLELRAVVRVRESETPAYLGVSDVFIYLIKTQRAIWPLTCFKNIQSISYS